VIIIEVRFVSCGQVILLSKRSLFGRISELLGRISELLWRISELDCLGQ